MHVAAEKAVLLDPLASNAKTVGALKAARRGELGGGTANGLLGSLNDGCSRRLHSGSRVAS